MTIKIRYSNFWHNSDPQQNLFFTPLIERVFETKVELVNSPDIYVDIEISSVFQSHESLPSKVKRRVKKRLNSNRPDFELSARKAKRRIWYTGENKRPPLNEPFDSFLSYERQDLISNVHYLPLWVLNFDNFQAGKSHGFTEQIVNQESLLQPRVIGRVVYESREFCCAFIGNHAGFRLGILRELERVHPINTFGSFYGEFVPDKSIKAERYNFSFAFENNLYPGYVTEKLLESYLCSNVPIYWGEDTFRYFNPKSFINFHGFDSVDSFIETVREVGTNKSLYEEMYSQPLLLKKYSIDDLVSKLRLDLM